jgi:hypothetical protein
MVDPTWDLIKGKRETLPRCIAELFTNVPAAYRGRVSIARGYSSVSRLFGRLIGLPCQSADLPFRLKVYLRNGDVIRERHFGDHRMMVRNWEKHGRLYSELGHFTIITQPEVRHGTLSVKIQAATLYGVPLPWWLAPVSYSFYSADDAGRATFDISMELPGDELLVRYTGWIEPVSGATA